MSGQMRDFAIEKAEASDCDAVLEDEALIARLSDVHFDAAIIEIAYGCGVLLSRTIKAKRLVLISVSMYCANWGSISSGSPTLPSVLPTVGSGIHYNMDFKGAWLTKE